MLIPPRVLSALLLVSLPAVALAQKPRPELGQVFAEVNCAKCHAIGMTGTSPLAAAPAFRDLHRRYPVDNLAEALAEGIGTGHESMPEFKLEPETIADFLAYLKTLQP